jgi:hypothetical protein
MGPKIDLNYVEKRKFFPFSGVEFQTFCSLPAAGLCIDHVMSAVAFLCV